MCSKNQKSGTVVCAVREVASGLARFVTDKPRGSVPCRARLWLAIYKVQWQYRFRRDKQNNETVTVTSCQL